MMSAYTYISNISNYVIIQIDKFLGLCRSGLIILCTFFSLSKLGIKGQLISECLFEKIVWTKIPTKNLIDSAQQRLLPQG